MHKVINFEERRLSCKHDEPAADDKSTEDDGYSAFLTDEGLDLLAAYRSIRDAALRKAILQLVIDFAQLDKRTR